MKNLSSLWMRRNHQLQWQSITVESNAEFVTTTTMKTTTDFSKRLDTKSTVTTTKEIRKPKRQVNFISVIV